MIDNTIRNTLYISQDGLKNRQRGASTAVEARINRNRCRLRSSGPMDACMHAVVTLPQSMSPPFAMTNGIDVPSTHPQAMKCEKFESGAYVNRNYFLCGGRSRECIWQAFFSMVLMMAEKKVAYPNAMY